MIKQTKIKQNLTNLILIIVVLSLLVLSGCGGSGTYGIENVDYHKGTDGLVVNFMTQAPPDVAYEETEFDVQIFVENKGAFDLTDGYRATAHLKYDDSFVMPITQDFLGQGLYSNKDRLNLYGKSYYFPDGEENFFALDRFYGLPIQGNFETNKASFYLSMCYPYETFFADEICIDMDPSNINPRTKICTAGEKGYSGGQGAPIAVTGIESQMVPRGVYIQPQFVIHLKHVGGGSFALQNLQTDTNGDAGCGPIDIDSVGRVEVEAKLGLDELDCKPEEILFRNNEATLYCQLPEEQITGVGANYLTTMTVDIKYMYMQNFQKDIFIKRSEGTLFSKDRQPRDDWDCYPWEIFIEGSENDCVEKCEYCASHSGVEACKVTDKKKDGDIKIFSADHACSYRSTSDCIEAGDDCILQSGFCQTGSYCGIPKCYGDTNAQPFVTVNPKSAENQIQVFCHDQDDISDPKRTCGCENIAQYVFIENTDKRACQDIPLGEYSEMTNGFYNSANGRMEYSLFLADIHPESDLCLRVEDKTNAENYKRLSYPWT